MSNTIQTSADQVINAMKKDGELINPAIREHGNVIRLQEMNGKHRWRFEDGFVLELTR